MSWPDRPSRLRPTLLVVALAFGLGGCFSPLYMGAGNGLEGRLQAISVDPVSDQVGHYLRDALISNLNGTGAKVPARYRLVLTSTERVQTALIDVVTSRAQNAAVITDITYKLLPIDGTVPIAAGVVQSAAVYDRSAQRFADIRAARDAEIRNARTVADQITTQLAAKLGERPVVP